MRNLVAFVSLLVVVAPVVPTASAQTASSVTVVTTSVVPVITTTTSTTTTIPPTTTTITPTTTTITPTTTTVLVAVGTPPVPKAKPKASKRGCPEYEGYMVDNGLPVKTFSPIAWRESKCNPAAYNGRNKDRSYGIFQINTKGSLWGEIQRRCGLTDKEQLFDPPTNIACAAALYRTYGTRPWSNTR